MKAMPALAISLEKDTFTNKIYQKKSNSSKFISDIAESNFAMTSLSKLIIIILLIYSTLYALQNPRCNV